MHYDHLPPALTVAEGIPLPSASEWAEMKRVHRKIMEEWTGITAVWCAIQGVLAFFVFICNTEMCPDHEPQYKKCMCRGNPLESPNADGWCVDDQRCVNKFYCDPLNVTTEWSPVCVRNHAVAQLIGILLILVIIPAFMCWPCKSRNMYQLRQRMEGH